jgi:hypothetical protein
MQYFVTADNLITFRGTSLRVRRPRVAEASAEAQALREGGLKQKAWYKSTGLYVLL